MTDPATFHEAVWGFQVQQTIEKSLKAWLYLMGVEPPFTHDLVALLKRLRTPEPRPLRLERPGRCPGDRNRSAASTSNPAIWVITSLRCLGSPSATASNIGRISSDRLVVYTICEYLSQIPGVGKPVHRSPHWIYSAWPRDRLRRHHSP
jgi:HEPN domain